MELDEYKRKKEFIDAWCDGKLISVINKCGGLYMDNEGKPRVVNPTEDSPYNVDKFIINDEYLHLRIAIKSSMEIEYKSIVDQEWTTLEDNLTPTRHFSINVDRYRVKKRDTSWVKSGEYAVHIESKSIVTIKIIDDGVLMPIENSIVSPDEFVKFYRKHKFQYEDVCWFWDNGKGPIVRKFKMIGNLPNGDPGGYLTEFDVPFENCAPYLGEKFWEKQDA